MNPKSIRTILVFATVAAMLVATLSGCSDDSDYEYEEESTYESSSSYDSSDDYDSSYDSSDDYDYDHDGYATEDDYSGDTLLDEDDFVDTEDGTYVGLEDGDGNTIYMNTDGSDAYVDSGSDGSIDSYGTSDGYSESY